MASTHDLLPTRKGEEPDLEAPGATTAVTISERLRLRAVLDAAIAAAFGLTHSDLRRILDNCDLPTGQIAGRQLKLNPKGFWRLDRQLDPEVRHTVLTLVAISRPRIPHPRCVLQP